jgi:hypothetical protein
MTNKVQTVTLEVATSLVVAAAQTEHAYEAAIAAFKAAPVDFAYYKKLRAAFVTAKRQASGCSVDAASKAWERLCIKCAYKAPKSDTPAAKAKAAQRAKAAPAKGGQPDNVSGSLETPTTGKVKAGDVEMKLSAIEANIIKWLRAGQWAMLDGAIKAQRDMAAPM